MGVKRRRRRYYHEKKNPRTTPCAAPCFFRSTPRKRRRTRLSALVPGVRLHPPARLLAAARVRPPRALLRRLADAVQALCAGDALRAGLAALTLDETLCGYARVKSQDMHDQGYFSHTSPTYGSPFDMMRAFGVSYRTAGENIAMGYATPAAVVEAWMNSEGHRANILSANYTTLGVGYVADGGYWTQWFIG